MTVSRRARFDVRASGRQIVTVLLVVLVANIVAYAALVRPRIAELRRLTAESAPRLQQLENREAEVRIREEYVAALERAGTDLEHLRGEVLSTKRVRMIDVQFELANLARRFGINLKRVQYENEVLADEGMERFGMVVPLEGGYASLRRFLQAVEKSREFLVIEEVSLAGKEGGGNLLQLSITLATYFDAPELRKKKRPKPVGRRSEDA